MAKKSVVLVTPAAEAFTGGPYWEPHEGDACRGVLERALPHDEAARDTVRDSAAHILSQGVDPKGMDAAGRTGLVVGYVQSGKTLSFTTAIGMARDNGFPLVIVLAGTKNPLLEQSEVRLDRVLDVASDEGAFAWRLMRNPNADNEGAIRRLMDNWRDADEDERPTLVLVVLKQYQRLDALTATLSKVKLNGIPVLVIDDEADQASLNTKVRKNEESATFASLKALRQALPRHTFLQYTATPQAPLLINLLNTLSPDFVHVLKTGGGYVGGKDFFGADKRYVRTIPALEVYPDDALPAEPPPSLVEAMRLFFVGLAATLIEDARTGKPRRRSMLMHPSRVRAVHRTITRWASAVIQSWKAELALIEGDPDRAQTIAEFRTAYDELLGTAPDLPPFDDVVRQLPRALRKTEVIEFNTNGRPSTPKIVWQDARGWILVGGQAVDRGFTVDSLTVTYMPRGLGMANADAVQQRARFFGYKRGYLGLCRIYLEADTRDAFEKYVEHEEAMRASLAEVAAKRESLKLWKRRFILDPALKPCRDSVIALGDEYIRRGNTEWMEQRGARLTEDVRQKNAVTIRSLVSALHFAPDTTYQSALLAQQHEVAGDVPIRLVSEFLGDYLFPDPDDTASSVGIMVQLSRIFSENPGATVRVLRMRPRFKSMEGRQVDGAGRFPKGFLQGRTGKGTTSYPGDRAFIDPDKVTLQLHSLDLKQDGMMVARGAPLVAIHVPNRLVSGWLVQHPART